MWKRACFGATCLGAFVIGAYLPTVSAEEHKVPEAKIQFGYVASDLSHPVSFEGVNPVPVFENDVGKIYAVTKFEKMTGDSQIKYLWFYKEKIMHEAALPLKENQWKAQSGINIQPKWTGKWRVDVTSGEGTLLYSISFIVNRKPDTVQASSPVPVRPDAVVVAYPVSTSTESASVP